MGNLEAVYAKRENQINSFWGRRGWKISKGKVRKGRDYGYLGKTSCLLNHPFENRR